jgi:YrbI family 3-deoxy-D-manno-octulosonate 8-phosphate phosphatase
LPNQPLPIIENIHTIVFDFDGVFTDNKVWVHQDGSESVRCDRSDGLGFDLIKNYQKKNSLQIDMFILSKEANPVVLARANKLKLDCYHGVLNKSGFSGLVYLGNDLNDLSLMSRAGCSIAPSDAHVLIKNVASLVLNEKGGEGFIRSFIEKLLRLDNLTEEEIHELVSNC